MADSPRRLALLRHSKAAWPDGVPDIERPLAPRGQRDAPVAGAWLHTTLGRLDLVVMSPARRVEQTWQLAAAAFQELPDVRVDERLYGEPVDRLLEVVRELSDDLDTVLMVGHNPELSALASELAGSDVELSTSSIAVLEGTGSWSDARPGWAWLAEAATPRAR
jgi:phosphohistidine phosphatase